MNMKRFFEFLFPERTHLKAVIAALVAIFLLSGALAYQVHRSEKARVALRAGHLEAFDETASSELLEQTQTRVFNQLEGVFSRATHAADAGASDDSVVELFNVRALCYDCREPAAKAAIALHDPDQAATLPRAAVDVLSRSEAGTFGRWETGIFFSPEPGPFHAYAFVRQQKNKQHGWVLPLSSESIHRLTFLLAETTQLVSKKFTGDIPQSALFRVEATAPSGAKLYISKYDSVGVAQVSKKLEGPFLAGMTWSVGLLPRGVATLTPPTTIWLTPNLLYLMMALIAGAIAMAIALVRREEELHRLRSDLISGVSHELRTPLAQIRMFAETLLLGRTRTEAERRRSLEVIDQEAKRLSHFVENMLQFAKGEGGRARLAPEHTSFAAEIRRTVESFAPMCQARGVEVRTELEEGVTAPVDRAALRRIMLNLMENALKYGPDEQRITVGIAIFNDVVRVWVDDEGEGIPRLDRERVFDSFYRLNRELDRRVTGSGIGLAVVRQLATLHGGRAWAEDAPGGGARLVVEFPDAYVRQPEEGSSWAVA